MPLVILLLNGSCLQSRLETELQPQLESHRVSIRQSVASVGCQAGHNWL